MKISRTARLKLNISENEVLPSLVAYTNAFNLVCQTGYDSKIFNGIELHKLTYNQTREQFKLPSQLAISVRMKATEALKSIRKVLAKKKYVKCPQSKLTSIRLDCNSYSILKSGQISILTVNGRKKFKLDIPDYYKEYFTDWKHTSADLLVKNHTVFLHISFEKEIADVKPNGKVLGIDRGINKLAVTSDKKFYSGDKLKFICQKYKTLRSNLQKKGTQSAKRHLKKLSGKEKRFKADVNHKISKQIVNSLNPGDIIALEKLTGIRNQKRRKQQRAALNSWNYYQLEQFITYKAVARGIDVVYVNPAYTSKMCSRCGHIEDSNRPNQANFCCKFCGFKLNADLNASKNISSRALLNYKLGNEAVVNQPIVKA